MKAQQAAAPLRAISGARVSRDVGVKEKLYTPDAMVIVRI
mgnify:CR=1 FL=1